MMLTKVIYDLNPYNPEAAKIIEMRVHFSPQLLDLTRQAQHEQGKAVIYLQYLARAEKEVAKMADARRYEPSPRWQANYDLLYAQLVAYQARMYEYGAYLEEFINKPKIVPFTKPPNLTLDYWDIVTRQRTITGDVVKPYMDRATVMFKEIIENHPGTPWARVRSTNSNAVLAWNSSNGTSPPIRSSPLALRSCRCQSSRKMRRCRNDSVAAKIPELRNVLVMRLGIFGGSFDPVHYGHLLLAETCREACRLDEVWLIPAAVPPHKRDREISPARQRIDMLELALAGNDHLRVSTLEIDRGGVSYTVDTLRAIKDDRPAADLFFLMGADSLRDLSTWREPAEICRLAYPLVVRRSGATGAGLGNAKRVSLA